MNPLALLEKLITEHGSSAIQGKHLALLKEQLAIQDRKTTELQSENRRLKTEILELQSQLQQREAEMHRLELATQQQRTAHRSKTEEKILLLLTDNRRMTSRQLANHLGITVDRAEVMLHDVREAELVYLQSFTRLEFEPSRPTEWYLTNDGKRYLIRHNLIQ